jgi:hypothetical protein
MNEDLNKWFKEKWVNIGKKVDGKHPPCGTSGEKRGYAKCVPAAKAAGMSKKEKESATQRKRAAQNDAGRGGKDSSGQGKKPINVSTKPKNEEWSDKYKSSIDCNNPKGFSQKAHCQGKKKNENMNIEERLNLFLEKNCPTDSAKWSASKSAAKSKFDVYPSAYANGWAAKNYKSKGGGWKTCSENIVNEEPAKTPSERIRSLNDRIKALRDKMSSTKSTEQKNLIQQRLKNALQSLSNIRKGLNEACWDGYKQVGGKMKNGKMVPNCVPVSEDINSDDDVNYGYVEPEEYDVEDEDMVDFIGFMRTYSKDLSEANCNCVYEAEYQGREVKLGKPMQGDVKKFKVYVKNPAGNVVKVNFGQKGMKIRKSNPAARKSFRARMNCDSPGPRTKANYWSCRKW